jgi:drug/metabolite transporter (DMT)-like permease
MGLYYAMLVRGTVARASANFYLVPGTAAVLACLFLGERPSMLAVVGLITASAGCWLVAAEPSKLLPDEVR